MHGEAREYVRAHLPDDYGSVLEVGSRDINGGVRDLLDPDARYTGIDISEGPGVDHVADFAVYTHHERVDLILCCEVMEHTPHWREIVASAAGNLRSGGIFIVTCATTGRPAHSGITGGGLEPGEHYENIEEDALVREITKHFQCFDTEVRRHDLRAWAVR